MLLSTFELPQEPMRFVLMCYTARLSFCKNQSCLLLCVYQVQLSFCWCLLINV